MAPREQLERSPVVSLADVARRAGVSPGTVSHVLNQRADARISLETQQRVRLAANEMGYRPNQIARALVTGRTQILGVLVCDFYSHTSSPVLIGVVEAARERGYRIQLVLHPDSAVSADSALRELMSHRMDGLVSITARMDDIPDLTDSIGKTGLPYVLANHHNTIDDSSTSIVVDNVHGGILATSHLLGLGRRRLAFVGGPPDRTATRGRLEGFRQAHAKQSATCDPSLIIYEPFSIAGGIQAGEILFGSDTPNRPDAIFTGDDSIAIGLMRCLRTKGIRVPQDVAVVGFNDLDLVCEAAEPTLTSVRPPLMEVGRLSVENLIDRLKQPEDWKPSTTRLPCRLIVRQSA